MRVWLASAGAGPSPQPIDAQQGDELTLLSWLHIRIAWELTPRLCAWGLHI